MTDKENPLVSVIVRTKDRPGLLRTALRSIASQDYRPIEVVLINDGGSDLDVNAATQMLNNCSLRYIQFEKGKGRAAAGNAGISAAEGKYIGFLDDDDEYCSDHLSVLVDYLEGNDTRVAYTDSELVVKEMDIETGSVEIKDRKVFSSYDFSYVDLMVANYIPLISILFSSEVLQKSGGFDEKFNLYEDWDLLLRIGENFPFHHIRMVSSLYNQWNKGSQIAQAAEPHIINSAFTRIFSKHQHKITPEVILNLNRKQEMLSKELKHLIKKHTALESELYKRFAELRQINDELQRRDMELQQRDRELYQMTSQLSEAELEAERLSNDYMQTRQVLGEMQSTLGWQFLDKIRNIRDKLLPRGTARGRIYQRVISRIKGDGT